jgi:hypothetical protein
MPSSEPHSSPELAVQQRNTATGRITSALCDRGSTERHGQAVPVLGPRPVRTFGQPPGSATRGGRAAGWPRSGQPWRAFQRGFRLLSTNTLRPRRTTTDPAFCFNALSEFLAFIVRRPFGPSSLHVQVVEAATIFLRSKFPAWQTPVRSVTPRRHWNGAAGCRLRTLGHAAPQAGTDR